MKDKKTKIIANIVDELQKIHAYEVYPMSDVGSRQLLADMTKKLYRYNTTEREFNRYNKRTGIWETDSEGLSLADFTVDLAVALNTYARTLNNAEQYSNYATKWLKCEYRPKIIKEVRSVYPLSNDMFDLEPLIFNCLNKVLKLKRDGTIEVMEHSPDLYLSKVANVTYSPDITSELWIDTYTDIMQSDKPIMEYLQKLLGYCLSGLTEYEKMWFLYSVLTRNGKSTICESIVEMMGGYAGTLKPESVAEHFNTDSRNANTDLVGIRGKRLILLPEPKRGMRLDVGLIKQISGNDTLRLRGLYEKETDFRPQCKLLMNCNYLPVVNDMTLFTSNRAVVIPFKKHYSDDEQDLTLKPRLIKPRELTGILNFCLTGWQMFCKEGLTSTEGIKVATADYAEGSDKTQNFVNDCLISSTGNNVAIKTAYEVYTKWCEDNGYMVENKSNFVSELKNRNLYRASGTIRGKSIRNIIPNVDIKSEWQPAQITPYDKGKKSMQTM